MPVEPWMRYGPIIDNQVHLRKDYWVKWLQQHRNSLNIVKSGPMQVCRLRIDVNCAVMWFRGEEPTATMESAFYLLQFLYLLDTLNFATVFVGIRIFPSAFRIIAHASLALLILSRKSSELSGATKLTPLVQQRTTRGIRMSPCASNRMTRHLEELEFPALTSR